MFAVTVRLSTVMVLVCRLLRSDMKKKGNCKNPHLTLVPGIGKQTSWKKCHFFARRRRRHALHRAAASPVTRTRLTSDSSQSDVSNKALWRRRHRRRRSGQNGASWQNIRLCFVTNQREWRPNLAFRQTPNLILMSLASLMNVL